MPLRGSDISDRSLCAMGQIKGTVLYLMKVAGLCSFSFFQALHLLINRRIVWYVTLHITYLINSFQIFFYFSLSIHADQLDLSTPLKMWTLSLLLLVDITQ